MKTKTGNSKKYEPYQAPVFFVGLFYVLLLAWTVVCIVMIGSKALQAGWPLFQLFMIAFVLGYTWYFSLGISYKFMAGDGAEIELTSFRRVIRVNAKDVAMVEGPRFAIIPYAFIRFRLEREKAYLFCCITDSTFQENLQILRTSNPGMKFRGL
jgi:hypothetical protein